MRKGKRTGARWSLHLPQLLDAEVEALADEKEVSKHQVVVDAVAFYTRCKRLEKRRDGEITGLEITDKSGTHEVIAAMTPV